MGAVKNAFHDEIIWNALDADEQQEWLATSPDGRRMAETQNSGSGRKPDQQVPGSKTHRRAA